MPLYIPSAENQIGENSTPVLRAERLPDARRFQFLRAKLLWYARRSQIPVVELLWNARLSQILGA